MYCEIVRVRRTVEVARKFVVDHLVRLGFRFSDDRLPDRVGAWPVHEDAIRDESKI